MSSQAFCSIKTQFENVGDALIIRELIHLIAARTPITVELSRCPPEFRKTLDIDSNGNVSVVTFGFPALFRQILRARLKGVSCSYFLIPGGLGGEKRPRAAVMAHVFNVILWALRVIGVRANQVGVSYERVGPRHGAILRRRTRLMHRHMVRDHLTLDYAKSLGLRVDGVLPDLAFNLFRLAPRPASQRPAIAFSFRTDKSPEQKEIISALIEKVCRLAPEGTVFKFVSQVGRDAPFMRAMAEKVRLDIGEAHFVDCSDDIEACQDSYAECVTVYSNRLHALMLAMSAGARPFAFVDEKADAKIIGIFADAGWSQDIHTTAALPDDATLGASLEARPPVDGSRQARELGTFFDTLLGPERGAA